MTIKRSVDEVRERTEDRLAHLLSSVNAARLRKACFLKRANGRSGDFVEKHEDLTAVDCRSAFLSV